MQMEGGSFESLRFTLDSAVVNSFFVVYIMTLSRMWNLQHIE
jgi:hypothetical protein